jgi:hypothetical protein
VTKPHQEDQAEPFFSTEEVETELIAAGYEFAPPGHARTASIRELFGWRPGETLAEAVSRHVARIGTASGCELRGKDI